MIGIGQTMNYELKQINGIPYYLHGTTLYTFELEGGKPSSTCTAIGTYDGNTITYLPAWRESVQSSLAAFRTRIISQPRDTFRNHIDKPQKQRKTTRAPRKPTAGRAKNPASVE
jgi:hypothetical protein